MDPFTTPIKCSAWREGHHVFTKADVLEFIDSFDFPNIQIVCEVAMSGDEINSEPFVKSFFEELAAVILKRCPPKISPKKLVERMRKRAYEGPLQSKYSTPSICSSRESPFKSCSDEGTSSRSKSLKEEDDHIQSDDKMGDFFFFI
jgi:hypothetical protein